MNELAGAGDEQVKKASTRAPPAMKNNERGRSLIDGSSHATTQNKKLETLGRRLAIT
jgi:hypothetical protein